LLPERVMVSYSRPEIYAKTFLPLNMKPTSCRENVGTNLPSFFRCY
jgi:hypothetical protein